MTTNHIKKRNFYSLVLCVGVFLNTPACDVSDADLGSSGLASFSLSPSANDVDVLQVEVNGAATLAYTSTDSVDLAISVNGDAAYSESIDASSSLSFDIAAVLPLAEGENEVVAELLYNGHSLQEAFIVTVAEGAQGLILSPAATEVGTFDVDVDVDTTLGFLSEEDATLEVLVNGSVVHSESVDASTDKAYAATVNIPLEREGPNEVIANLRYQGNSLTERATVEVSPAVPTATFPAWSTSFTQSNTVAIAMDAAWNTTEVAFSIDGGEFLPAEDLGSGDYTVALENLDIGDSALTLRVRTENAGHEQVHRFHDVIAGIVPVFDCAQSNNMIPTSTLIANNNFEVRSMLGYFGDPDGGHTVTFIIEFIDDNGDQFINPASVLTKGRSSMDVEYNVDRFRCGNSPCSENYDLSLVVDGVGVCSQNSFGTIRDL